MYYSRNMPGLATSLFIFLTLICLMPLPTTAQEKYGLEFASKGIAQEYRTTLELFPGTAMDVKNEFSLTFDLSLTPNAPSYFGYVFRMVDNKDQNIDLVYDVHNQSFNLVAGNEFSGISFKADFDKICHQWQHIRLDFNINKRLIKLSLNGQTIDSAITALSPGHQLKIFFGANHYKELTFFDLPPMRIKDIKIYQEDQLQYHWALNQTNGNTDTDLVNKKVAFINNPVWLAHTYHEWNKTRDFVIKGNASVAYDHRTGTLYINGSDSIYISNNNNLTASKLARPRGLSSGNIAVFDEQTHQICNFLVDEKKVARYDSTHHTWDNVTNAESVTRYWHSNRFFSRYDSSIYIFGGYGDYHYKNEVQRAGRTWETLKVTGDHFTPRYMAALGANINGDSAYIIGGYGSLKGDQLLNPHNLYDLTLFDVKHKTFKKIYELPEPAQPFVFGNSMIIDTHQQCYYALTFANDRSQSSLQLIKGSLSKPVYTRLASSIPFRYFDVKSRAELFYDQQNEKLITVILFSENNTTRVQIYTILFPPSELTPHTVSEKNSYLWTPLACLLLGIVAFLSIIKRKKKVVVKPAFIAINVQEEIPVPEILPKPAILLFGDFTVIDKTGEDISKLFSPLLKELFLLLLLHSVTNKTGISSEKINEILWAGRSVKDAKNNRSVNMVKLKNILDKIGEYTLIKENGKWLLLFSEGTVDIDLQNFYHLLSNKDIEELVRITGRGIFLGETEYSWLDKFKSDISADIIPVLTQFLEDQAPDPGFIIAVCNCILHFDSLCEEAIMFKCRALVALRQHSTAKALYSNFTKEYQAIYGETFEKDYIAVLEQ